jgi:DNA-binding transcriptional regulator YdaS (Cro superfamily)
MNGYNWIVKVRDKLNLTSDNQAAAKLGISRSAVSQHKSGKVKYLNDEQCLQVAKILGISPENIIADQHLEGAKSAEEKAVWLNILKLTGRAAAILTGAAITLPTQILTAPLCILC